MPLRSAKQDPCQKAKQLRRAAVADADQSAGLLEGQTSSIQARIKRSLLSAAKKQSGINLDTELLEYALA